jgi:hypothetical protein
MARNALNATVRLVHPDPILPITNAVVGTVLILIAILSVILYSFLASDVARAVSAATSVGDNGLAVFFMALVGLSPRAQVQPALAVAIAWLPLSLLFFVVVFAPRLFQVFKTGGFLIGKAIIQWFTMGHPEDVPIPYHDPARVITAISDREQYVSKLPREAIGIAGHGVQYLSPVASAVVQPIINRLIRAGSEGIRQLSWPIFLGVILFGFVIASPGWNSPSIVVRSLVELLTEIGSVSATAILATPYLFWILVILVPLAIDWHFVRTLASRARPPAETITQSANTQAPMPPFLLSERFQQHIDEAPERSGDKPDRLYRGGSEGASPSVSNSGNFVICGLIERFPQSIENPNRRAAVAHLLAGWCFVLIGLTALTLFLLPSATWLAVQSHTVPGARVLLDPALILLKFLGGRRAVVEGGRMVREGETLLETFWFKAATLTYDFRGVTSKSEIGVGTALDDSIRTKSEIVNSVFVARFIATSIISEIPNLTGDRVVYSMKPTDECRILILDVVRSLKHLSEYRPSPVGIDLGHPDVANITNANATAKAAKTAAEQYAIRNPYPNMQIGVSHHLQLGNQSSSEDNDSEAGN